MFQYANVASIGPAMSFRVFDVSFSRGWGSVSLFQHPILVQSWCSFFLLKEIFIPSRTMFQCLNVASIGPAVLFRVFDVSFSTGWGSVSLLQHPILVQSGCSFFPLKEIFYTFQDHVSICKCGQYWSCNVISSF